MALQALLMGTSCNSSCVIYIHQMSHMHQLLMATEEVSREQLPEQLLSQLPCPPPIAPMMPQSCLRRKPAPMMMALRTRARTSLLLRLLLLLLLLLPQQASLPSRQMPASLPSNLPVSSMGSSRLCLPPAR